MENDSLENDKYIVFQIADNKFSIPLMSAMEVVECNEVQKLPKAKNYFDGVTNIRGEVVAVIDIRKRFGLNSENSNVLIMFEFNDHTLGARVDKLIRVDQVDDQDIDAANGVKSNMYKDYVKGIYKKDNEIVTIIDIKGLLVNEQISVA